VSPGAPNPVSEMRTRALRAFVALVAERGYQNVEMSEVDERAALPGGSAGRLIGDSLTCFESAWELLEGAFLERVRAAYRPRQGWRGQLRAALTETAALLNAFPAEGHFMAVDALSVGEPGRARQQALATRLAAFLDQARAESERPGEAPAATSGWVIGILFDRVYRYSASGREAQLGADVGELMFLAVSAYFGPEAGLEELRE
jgi:hypothetical protein